MEDGSLHRLLTVIAEDLRDRGKVGLTEAYIDGSHAGAKRGALMLGSVAAARRPRSWQWQTAVAFLSPSGLQGVSELSASSHASSSSRGGCEMRSGAAHRAARSREAPRRRCVGDLASFMDFQPTVSRTR